MPADNNCIYVINIQDQPLYDCADRLSTSTTKMTMTTCQTTKEIQPSERRNQSLYINQTDQDLLQSRTWTGLPFWYIILRWGCFATLLIVLCLVNKCTKTKHITKRAKRQRNIYYSQKSSLAR
ncbi:hypothetical protein LDENG_00245080 [Lucifuga dentata]|nr:hypothetical protein LDENG_00245080 [Lucifuga dentata]